MAKYDKLKKQLQDRLKELGARVDEIEDDLRSPHSTGWEDRATETAGDEVLEGLEDSALAEAQAIRMALEKIENGSYGECVTCGEEIDPKRLAALPYATQCIDCAK
jgi:RNA polymerase-binding transcription factor DksA